MRRGCFLAGIVAAVATCFALAGSSAIGALPACSLTTLIPSVRDVSVNQGVSPYAKLARGKETLVRVYLSLPTGCTAGRSQSLSVTNASLSVSNGDTAQTIAPYQSLSAGPVLTSAIQTDSAADPLFVVPSSLLAPTATGTFSLSLTPSVTSVAKDGRTTGAARTTAYPATTATVEQRTNALRILVVPMGDRALAFSSQFSATAQQAVQNGMGTLSRMYPVPSGVGDLGGTGGIRYTIDLATLLDLRSVTGAYDANNKFCGTGLNFGVIKGLLSTYLQTWNANNPGAVADRVVGVVDEAISDGGATGCAEGMASLVSPEAWVRAIPDKPGAPAVPSNTGGLLGMEMMHTFGAEPSPRSSTSHSSNIQADAGTNRSYNDVARSFISADHTVMRLDSSTGPWNNDTTVMEPLDFAYLMCSLGGTTSSECTGAGTVGTSTFVAAAQAFVMTGTVLVDSSGVPSMASTHVNQSYFSEAAPITPGDDGSHYWLVQRNGANIAQKDGAVVSFPQSLHHADDNATDSLGVGVFHLAFGGTGAAAIQFYYCPDPSACKNGDPASAGTLLYERSLQATPPVAGTPTTLGAGEPRVFKQESLRDTQPALTDDGKWIAWNTKLESGDTRIMVAPTSNASNATSVPVPASSDLTFAFTSTRTGNWDVFSQTGSGPATQLTTDTGMDFLPRYSPDGTKIAFISDRFDPSGGSREVFVMNADGSNQTQLTGDANHENEPSWSPGGTKIAYAHEVANQNQDIYVINADGSGTTPIIEGTSNDFSPAWSPDGSKIAFVSNRSGDNEIWVANADGTSPVNITNSPGTDFDPSWSPDGTKIAFRSERDDSAEIYVMNADGSNQTRLTPPDDGANDFLPAWTRDGAKIGFQRQTDSKLDVFAMNADGTNAVDLTNDPASAFHVDFAPAGSSPGVSVSSPAWRADRSALAYISGGDIFTVSVTLGDQATFGTPRRIYSGSTIEGPPQASNPTWSRDGSRIAFAGGDQIYTISSDGGAATLVTTTESALPASDPSWSHTPGDDRIAFRRGETVCESSCATSVWLVDPATHTESLLVENAAHPWFGPSGRIAFTRNGAIWSISSGGGAAQQLTFVPNGDSGGVLLDYSPSLATDTLAFHRFAQSFCGAACFASNAVMLASLEGSTVAGQITSPAAANLRADLIYTCGSKKYPVDNGVAPESVSGNVASFLFNFDQTIVCGPAGAGGGTLTLFGSDGVTRSIATATATIPVDPERKAPVASILSVSEGAVYSQDARLPFRGYGKDAEDGELSGTALQWSLTRPGTGGTTAEGDSNVVDRNPNPGAIWPVGQYVLHLTVTDSNGMQGTASHRFTIVDKLKPRLNVTHTASGTNGGNTNQPVTVNVAAADDGSGLASVSCTDNGAAVSLVPAVQSGAATYQGSFTVSGYGIHVIECTATDVAGNTANPDNTFGALDTVQIIYVFGGFLNPINNPPTLNTGKAGRVYPVKWQLRNSAGSFVTSIAVVSSIKFNSVTCGEFSGDPTDALETAVAAGGSVLRYDSGANQFIYNWDTPNAAGCYVLHVTFNDGMHYEANFKLS